MYIIIGGGGDVGYYLTKSLLSHGHEVLLIEKGGGRFTSLSEELGTSVFRGDACEARTMEEVGASRADVVIADTGDDDVRQPADLLMALLDRTNYDSALIFSRRLASAGSTIASPRMARCASSPAIDLCNCSSCV